MSPDLNTIENLWRELEHIAVEEWQKLPADRCKKLLDGYKKFLEAAIVFITLQPNIQAVSNWLF